MASGVLAQFIRTIVKKSDKSYNYNAHVNVLEVFYSTQLPAVLYRPIHAHKRACEYLFLKTGCNMFIRDLSCIKRLLLVFLLSKDLCLGSVSSCYLRYASASTVLILRTCFVTLIYDSTECDYYLHFLYSRCKVRSYPITYPNKFT